MFVCVGVECCKVERYGRGREMANVRASFLNVSVVFAFTVCSGSLFQSRVVYGKNENL